MTKSTKRFLSKAALMVLAAVWLPAAKNGCGSEEANETFNSPVQAVTTLLELPDGNVSAELVLISTDKNPHKFVDTAKNVTVRTPDGDKVSLSLTTPGHYSATTDDDSKLKYVAGGRYQFTFDLDDDSADQVSGGNFAAIMDAPDDSVSADLTTPPMFAGDTSEITWKPSSRYAMIRITDESGKVAYENFNFEKAQFDGSKWARLKKGGSQELGVDVFGDPGKYTLMVCAVDKVSDFDKELSAELGALSGFLIGRCAPEMSVDVPE